MFHLTTIATLHLEALSPAQRSALRQAVAQLGPEGFDWRANVKRELETLHGLSPQASAALARITPAYIGVLDEPSNLRGLQQLIASAPAPLPEIVPNPSRVVEGKRRLTEKIQQTRALLQ
jgi:hypothetical protein